MSKRANLECWKVTRGMQSCIPLATLFHICEEAGYTLDPEETDCILCGWDGRAEFKLYRATKWIKMLVLTWHKFETGRYEVVAYVS